MSRSSRGGLDPAVEEVGVATVRRSTKRHVPEEKLLYLHVPRLDVKLDFEYALVANCASFLAFLIIGTSSLQLASHDAEVHEYDSDCEEAHEEV